MNVVDYVILGILLLGALIGFKNGIINSIVTFVGTLIVIILAFYLKNPISSLLYKELPFFSLGGKFSGVEVINILIFEAISYILTIMILASILLLIGKITGAIGKIVNEGLILGLPSRILGLVCGLLEGAVISFIIVFVLSLISGTSSLVNESKYADTLLTKTPGLSNIVGNTYKSVIEVYDICVDYDETKDKTLANQESLKVLLKYQIINKTSANNLVDDNKLTFKGARDIITKYGKE
jgi:uncharacterized membrane protein required for colicin V production